MELTPPTPATQQRLSKQARSETVPEIALRSALHRRGLRYRLHQSVVPGTRRKVDVVFTRARVAVDVRGCFWHGCHLHGSVPIANRAWWTEKLAANRARDDDTVRRLTAAGWAVVIVWEHEEPEWAASEIERLVRSRTV